MTGDPLISKKLYYLWRESLDKYVLPLMHFKTTGDIAHTPHPASSPTELPESNSEAKSATTCLLINSLPLL